MCPLIRVHELEEMVKDQETTAEQTLEEEARRHREAYSKLEREKSTEIELLNTRWVCWACPQSPTLCWATPAVLGRESGCVHRQTPRGSFKLLDLSRNEHSSWALSRKSVVALFTLSRTGNSTCLLARE